MSDIDSLYKRRISARMISILEAVACGALHEFSVVNLRREEVATSLYHPCSGSPSLVREIGRRKLREDRRLHAGRCLCGSRPTGSTLARANVLPCGSVDF